VEKEEIERGGIEREIERERERERESHGERESKGARGREKSAVDFNALDFLLFSQKAISQ
jgi:hypothetical protein